MIEQALKAYGQRLRGIRAELVAIAEGLAPIVTPVPDELPVTNTEATAKLADAIRGVCGILVRVIDSLGG